MPHLKAAALALLLFALSAGWAKAAPEGRWHVFLVAADRAEPVFDNAVDRLTRLFRSRPDVTVTAFTARLKVPRGKRPATWQEIERAIRTTRMAATDSCLFYFTSHGDERGLYMARHHGLLPPEALAELLDRACGARPTVVVVSACHSGTFIHPSLTAANRVIQTAARRDRSSFGCSTTETLTVYDRCFLSAWSRSADWRALHSAVSACVRATEVARGFSPPSEPQAFFGTAFSAQGSARYGLRAEADRPSLANRAKDRSAVAPACPAP